MHELRKVYIELQKHNLKVPVIIKAGYDENDKEKILLHSAGDIGGMLIDGFGDGIWLEAKGHEPGFINETSFGILQAARVRISKTEYISCPHAEGHNLTCRKLLQ